MLYRIRPCPLLMFCKTSCFAVRTVYLKHQQLLQMLFVYIYADVFWVYSESKAHWYHVRSSCFFILVAFPPNCLTVTSVKSTSTNRVADNDNQSDPQLKSVWVNVINSLTTFRLTFCLNCHHKGKLKVRQLQLLICGRIMSK